MARGELDKARAMFLASLDTWKALGDVGNQVLTLNNIGRVDHALAAEEQKANVRPDGPKSEPRGSSPLTPGSGAFQPPAPAPAAADAGGRGSPQPEDAGHVVQGVAHARGGAGGDSGAMAGNMSVREENLRYSAIRCFSDAAALLGQPDTQRSAAHLGAFRKVTEGNLAFAYFELAARLKQNFVALFSSHKDVEKVPCPPLWAARRMGREGLGVSSAVFRISTKCPNVLPRCMHRLPVLFTLSHQCLPKTRTKSPQCIRCIESTLLTDRLHFTS